MQLRNTEAEPNEMSDRRSHPRIAKVMPIDFAVSNGDHTSGIFFPKYDAQTYDISIGGISCNAIIDDKTVAEELSANKNKLKLNIQLVGKNNSISPEADVAWIYNLKGLSVKTKYRLGLRFVSMSKPENDFLSSYVGDIIVHKQEQRARNREKIKKVLAQIAKIDKGSFSEASRIRQDLGIDSLMAVETLAVLETIYEIEIDVSKIVDVVTVGDMVDLIENYSAQKV